MRERALLPGIDSPSDDGVEAPRCDDSERSEFFLEPRRWCEKPVLPPEVDDVDSVRSSEGSGTRLGVGDPGARVYSGSTTTVMPLVEGAGLCEGIESFFRLPQPPRPIVPAGLELLEVEVAPLGSLDMMRRMSWNSSEGFLRFPVTSSVGKRERVTLVGWCS